MYTHACTSTCINHTHMYICTHKGKSLVMDHTLVEKLGPEILAVLPLAVHMRGATQFRSDPFVNVKLSIRIIGERNST